MKLIIFVERTVLKFPKGFTHKAYQMIINAYRNRLVNALKWKIKIAVANTNKKNENKGINLKGTLKTTDTGFRVIVEGKDEEVLKEESKMSEAYIMVMEDTLKDEKNKRIIHQFFNKWGQQAKATAILYYKTMGVNIGHYIDGTPKEIIDKKPKKTLKEKMLLK